MGNLGRFAIAVLLLIIVIAGGTIEYDVSEGDQQGGESWTLTDSLCMTVIAMTTVGYGEVHRLSTEGRQGDTV